MPLLQTPALSNMEDTMLDNYNVSFHGETSAQGSGLRLAVVAQKNPSFRAKQNHLLRIKACQDTVGPMRSAANLQTLAQAISEMAADPV